MITITWNTNSRLDPSGNEIAIEVRNAEITTIPTLIKLLAINIVAKSWLVFLVI